jgi:hypothetical protein
MSTPATVFAPFLKEIDWTDATVDADGNPLPSGESLVFTALGVRADGDAGHSIGNYQYVIDVPAPAAKVTRADFDAAFKTAYPTPGALQPGNYWLNGQQEDAINGTTSISNWGTAEVPFSIPQVVVQPGAPGPFVVS